MPRYEEEESGSEILDSVIDKHKLHRYEGEEGVRNFCRIVRMLGYTDSQHFGQFDQLDSYGTLITFLEDNSGALEAMMEWLRDRLDTPASSEWVDNLKETLT
jgi:hypothetical protein